MILRYVDGYGNMLLFRSRGFSKTKFDRKFLGLLGLCAAKQNFQDSQFYNVRLSFMSQNYAEVVEHIKSC